MTKKYAVYKIEIKLRYPSTYSRESVEYHKLIFLKQFSTEEEAELYIKQSTKYTDYTILPKYYQTDFE